MEKMTLPGGGRLEAEHIEGLGEGADLGPGVFIAAKRIRLGRNVRIGTPDDEDAFRFPGGSRITVDELVLGDNVRIGRHVLIRGGSIEIRRDSRIGHACTVKVNKRLVIGEHGIVNEQGEIAGIDVQIGRELWMLPTAKIGGGSAFDVHSSLQAGHWLHLGMRTLVNTARPIVLGDEVGLGTGTSLYTHGAYPSALDGKPVAFGPITIGDRTWVPGAIINPSVSIGADCVIGVGSVVNKDVPAGSLAAGIPAKVLKENAYPRPLDGAVRLAFVRDFLKVFGEICADRHTVRRGDTADGAQALVGQTWVGYVPALAAAAADFGGASAAIVLTDDGLGALRGAPDDPTIVDLRARQLRGPATPLSERLLNQLRRYGVRFYFEAREGRYAPWA
jgi:acetyltransferase-like isoleucine patch superfamily enzyme